MTVSGRAAVVIVLVFLVGLSGILGVGASHAVHESPGYVPVCNGQPMTRDQRCSILNFNGGSGIFSYDEMVARHWAHEHSSHRNTVTAFVVSSSLAGLICLLWIGYELWARLSRRQDDVRDLADRRGWHHTKPGKQMGRGDFDTGRALGMLSGQLDGCDFFVQRYRKVARFHVVLPVSSLPAAEITMVDGLSFFGRDKTLARELLTAEVHDALTQTGLPEFSVEGRHFVHTYSGRLPANTLEHVLNLVVTVARALPGDVLRRHGAAMH